MGVGKIIGKAAGAIGSGVNYAREGVEKITPNPQAMKEGALHLVRDSYQTIRGSGSVTEELKKAVSATASLPFDAAGTALKACGQLLTFQPIEATKTAFKGATQCCKDVGQVIAFPGATTIAAAEQTLGAAKHTVGAVATLPLKAGQVAYNGAGNVVRMFTGGSSAGGSVSSAPASGASGGGTSMAAAA